MHYVALLERRGSGLAAQQIAASEFIAKRYILLPQALQMPLLQEDLRDMDEG